MDGVDLQFSDAALHKIVELTIQKGTGARGLRAVLEHALMDIMYDTPSKDGIRKLLVTDDTIEKGVEESDDEGELMRKRA